MPIRIFHLKVEATSGIHKWKSQVEATRGKWDQPPAAGTYAEQAILKPIPYE
jgi:hypothetical protein